MSNAVAPKSKTERHVHVRSKSSNPPPCFDNKCRHQICTCYKPSHKCPIDFNKPGHTPPSHYQAEYVKRDPLAVEPVRPHDNLKTGKEFFDGTVYQREYKAYRTPEDLAAQNAVNNQINHTLKSHNYNQDHLGFTTSLPTPDRVVDRGLTENYPKPAKFVIPRAEKIEGKPLQKDTEYTREFKPLRRDHSANSRINYDNLTVYHGPTANYTTTYNAEHIPKDNPKATNDHIADLNRKNNQLTYAQFLPKDNYGNKTEYMRKYEGKSPGRTPDCPIYDLPPLTHSQQRLPNHMYFDCQSSKWKKEKV
jgi:hypothetical protein